MQAQNTKSDSDTIAQPYILNDLDPQTEKWSLHDQQEFWFLPIERDGRADDEGKYCVQTFLYLPQLFEKSKHWCTCI